MGFAVSSVALREMSAGLRAAGLGAGVGTAAASCLSALVEGVDEGAVAETDLGNNPLASGDRSTGLATTGGTVTPEDSGTFLFESDLTC